MITLSKKYVKTNKYYYVVAAIAIYAIIFGMRYGVGADFFAYLHEFESMVKYGESLTKTEPGYELLERIAAFTGSSTFYFALVAFLQLFFVVLGFKEKKYIYPTLFFTFVFMATWLNYGNGLRQVLASCIWTFSIKYIIERKPIIHYLLVAVAITLHYSAWVLIIFYPIIRFSSNWFKKPIIEIALVILSLIVGNINVIQEVIQQSETLIVLLGYDNYLTTYDEMIESEVTLGAGFIIGLLIKLIVIFYSEKVKKFVNSDYYNILYSLYVVGVIIGYAFIGSQMISRINWYFNICSFGIVAFTLYYFKTSKQKVPFVALGSLTILTFAAIIYKAAVNTALFVFNWQDQFFALKKFMDM